MAGRERRRDAEAIRITTVGVSPAADTAGRQRRYLISMAVRTLCVVGAVVVGPGWLRWVLIAAAVVLPYVAVVAANVVHRGDTSLDLPGHGLGTPELPSGIGTGPDERLS